MNHWMKCDRCQGLGGEAVVTGKYPNATVKNVPCYYCKGTGKVPDPMGDGR